MGSFCGKNDKKPEEDVNSKKKYDITPYEDPQFKPINKTQLGLDFFKTLFTNNIERYVITEHKVKTLDGYILTLFRVNLKDELKDALETKHRKNHTVVLGCSIRISSDVWFQGNDLQSFGGYLVNEGYDVWCLNHRGLKYSIDHEDPNIHPKNFWDISFADHIVLDYPAMLKYIVDYNKMEETGEKMTHIGVVDSNFMLPMMLSTKGRCEEYKYLENYIEKAICTNLIMDMSKIQDKAIKKWGMQPEEQKAMKEKAEELGVYNWASTWKGSSRQWEKVSEYMVTEYGWGDYIYLLNFFAGDPEVDNFKIITNDRFSGRYMNEGMPLQGMFEFLEEKNKNGCEIEFKAYDLGEERNKLRFGTAEVQTQKTDGYNIPTHVIINGDNIDSNKEQNAAFKNACGPGLKIKEHELERYTFTKMFCGKNRKELRDLLTVIMLDNDFSYSMKAESKKAQSYVQSAPPFDVKQTAPPFN